MTPWKRPSTYLALLPIAGIALGGIAHWALGCGHECTGSITGPIDGAAVFALYLFGYGFWLFWGLALVSFVIELAYDKWRKRGTAS